MAGLVVVTGGTKGIGRAIVEKFAARGYDICTCARKQDELEQTASQVTRQFKVDVHYHVADLSDMTGIRSFIGFMGGIGKPVAVLVNNAGLFVDGQITSEAEGTLESLMSVNLYSAYHITRAVVAGMKARKSGHIFNMCSIASFMAYPNGGSYTITKFALLGFSKVLREEMKDHGVRVTSVMPGATMTSSWRGTDLPDTRFMKAEDIADAVFGAWSLSPQSVVEEIIIRPQLGDI
jgi:short-subunit dehydrogenase